MQFIIFDLEFNQSFKINKETKQLESGYINPKIPNEIIEIGAVKFNEDYKIIDTFRIFVKPYIYKLLHPKVQKITKISSEDLQYAFPFEKSIDYFKKWIGKNVLLCTWGKDDIIELKRNCDFYNIENEWINQYVDIQLIYQKIFRLNQQVSLKRVINDLNIKLENRIHRALNDSLYTYEVLKKLDVDNLNT